MIKIVKVLALLADCSFPNRLFAKNQANFYLGFHIITYFLMLYLLDRMIGFLAPRDLPDFGEE